MVAFGERPPSSGAAASQGGVESEILKRTDSYKFEGRSVHNSCVLNANRQPEGRNASRGALGGSGDLATAKCNSTLHEGFEGGSKADLRRSYRAKTGPYEARPSGLGRALSETRSFDVKADPVYVCYGGDRAADGRKARPGLQSAAMLGLSGSPMRAL